MHPAARLYVRLRICFDPRMDKDRANELSDRTLSNAGMKSHSMNSARNTICQIVLACSVTLSFSACIGGEPAPDGVPSAVRNLSLVDGFVVPAPAGTTGAGIVMIAKSGSLAGDVDGTDCSYTILFEEAASGAIVSQHADLTRQQCPLSNGDAITIETSFKRGDLPSGSHTYQFDVPSWRNIRSQRAQR